MIAIVATLDTKEPEALFVRDWLRGRGYEARLVDVGTLADPPSPLGDRDAGRAQVVAAAGTSCEALAAMRRDEAMASMGRGAGAVLRVWLDEGILAGVIGIGGHQGTTIVGIAMRTLPRGLPRVLVSTVASGNVRPHVVGDDTAVVFSVGDLLGGPNRVTRPALTRAAGMIAGMIAATGSFAGGSSIGGPAATVSSVVEQEAGPTGPGATWPAIAVTALGNTHAAVTRMMQHLKRRGYEAVPFHASGAGGSAMEALVRDGQFEAVVDLTPHELVGEILGDDIYAPVEAGRLTAAGSRGIPQVVAPGGLDYFVFGPPEAVPARYRDRPMHYHNPYNTNVRATAAELERVGHVLGRRLNEARGPTAFLYPLRGWSYIGREGGPLWDPAANDALRTVVRRTLRPEVRYVEVDAPINDSRFADEAGAVLDEFLASRAAPVRSRDSA